MSDPALPDRKSRTENLLFHSRIEICRILQLLALTHSPILAELQDGHIFESHILSVDTSTDRFSIAHGTQSSINAMLLDSASVKFTIADRQGLLFSFLATAPEDAQIAGAHVFQFALPKTLLLHNRRDHPRIPVSSDISLLCVADEAGVIPFESHITDISHDGLGCMIYSPDIALKKGTILKGCRIIAPNGDTVVADLELRFARPSSSADGAPTNRAGFHFIRKPERIDDLVNLFIQDLDKK
jgi:c-di-GMP-binding flagellar brake protein YcgR